ncbi:MAG: DUF3422 domain-containing protein [Pseudomonadota bacterium]
MRLPINHKQRFMLSNEVHARPPEPLTPSVNLTCIALTTNWPYREQDREIVVELTKQFGATPPGIGAKHYNVMLGGFKLIWERHTEFTRYTFVTKSNGEEPFETAAIEAAPADWVASLPGRVIAAANAVLVDELPNGQDQNSVSERFFDDNAVIGSTITGGSATAMTDFRVHSDGFSRFLVQNRTMTPWHAGRIVQRLLEIETYRIMALLALPIAQELSPQLTVSENELAEITTAMTEAAETEEPLLLERLTQLQANIEKGMIRGQYRFTAGNAYYDIVKSRIRELREERIVGMQTFQEFTERRLEPALNTCRSVARRQQTLSERVDRAAQLLSTRVDLSLEKQNQAVLESMNRRAELQLKLQQTVEGLSIAAISYYIIGLLAYFVKGVVGKQSGITPETVIAVSTPLVLLIVGAFIWRTRTRAHAPDDDAPATSVAKPTLEPTADPRGAPDAPPAKV